MIKITDTAADKLYEMKDSQSAGLRIKVTGGGCSGAVLGYAWDNLRKDDKVIMKDNLKVFIDNKSALYLIGSTLDYKEGLGGGLVLNNPNAKNSRGCGKSFGV